MVSVTLEKKVVYRSTITIILLFTAFLISVILVFPPVIYLLLCVNIIGSVYIAITKYALISFRTPTRINPNKKNTYTPYVCIQIAACNEPVKKVINTITAAIHQDYEHFEVLVLYNNTQNENLWKPIRDFCKNYENIKFSNHENLAGYKAGALNQCKKIMSDRVELILTVDADYILNSDALTKAVAHFNEAKVDLLQFPQSYKNHGPKNALAQEFKMYFQMYATAAGSIYKNLPTGTLTLVKACTIDRAGGWPETSITEDAYLGVELLKNHCTIGYSPEVIGQGTMPYSSQDLKSQRMRWVFGNFQTLVHTLRTKEFSFLSKRIIGIQLFSWMNFNGIPFLCIICASLLASVLDHENVEFIILLSIANITINTTSQFMVFYKTTECVKQALRTLSINIANSLEGAYTWWGYFVNSDRPFTPTNKFCKKVGLDLEQLLFNILLFLSGLCCFLYVNNYTGILIIILAVVRMASRIHLFLSFLDAKELRPTSKLAV